MITIKDYAKKHNVSYEAIRKQIKQYKNELDCMIVKQNRTQYLTAEAEAFLDAKRSDSVVVIRSAEKDEEIERLRNEREALLFKIASLQDELLGEKNKVVQLLESKSKVELLESKSNSLEEELSKFKPTWFGLYKKER